MMQFATCHTSHPVRDVNGISVCGPAPDLGFWVSACAVPRQAEHCPRAPDGAIREACAALSASHLHRTVGTPQRPAAYWMSCQP